MRKIRRDRLKGLYPIFHRYFFCYRRRQKMEIQSELNSFFRGILNKYNEAYLIDRQVI